MWLTEANKYKLHLFFEKKNENDQMWSFLVCLTPTGFDFAKYAFDWSINAVYFSQNIDRSP